MGQGGYGFQFRRVEAGNEFIIFITGRVSSLDGTDP